MSDYSPYSGLFTAIVKLFSNLFSSLPRKQIQKVVNIYDAMHSVLNETKVERLLINKAHNGGGLIKPTTPLYITTIYEDYTHPLTSVKDNYQKLQLDEEYVRTVLELCRAKQIRFKIADIKPSILKTLDEGSGIKFVEMRFLGQDKKHVYFATFVTTVEGETFDTPLQQAAINICANTIRNNIK